jgi:putative membrane protein
MRLLLRILINAAALWVATLVLGNSFGIEGSWLAWVGVAILFGLVNGLIRPIVAFFSIPITCVTLGLFTLVINALMLLLTSWLAGLFGINMQIGEGFINSLWTALLASIVISIVSAVLSWFLPDEKK